MKKTLFFVATIMTILCASYTSSHAQIPEAFTFSDAYGHWENPWNTVDYSEAPAILEGRGALLLDAYNLTELRGFEILFLDYYEGELHYRFYDSRNRVIFEDGDYISGDYYISNLPDTIRTIARIEFYFENRDLTVIEEILFYAN
ncbi:hypothetical protein [Marinifilum sp.]|uniref:hypothetical protein n=1 Tax=Marinifilum sp. TaxID=2033137 RepID=UPI003BA8E91E